MALDQSALEPDNLLSDVRDFEHPVKGKQSRESEATAKSRDDSRLEEDLRVLTEYNQILQRKFTAMQEEAIKKEAGLKLQI